MLNCDNRDENYLSDCLEHPSDERKALEASSPGHATAVVYFDCSNRHKVQKALEYAVHCFPSAKHKPEMDLCQRE